MMVMNYANDDRVEIDYYECENDNNGDGDAYNDDHDCDDDDCDDDDDDGDDDDYDDDCTYNST